MEKRIQDIRDKLARVVRAQRVCMFVQDSKANLTSDEEKWITTKKGEKGGGADASLSTQRPALSSKAALRR